MPELLYIDAGTVTIDNKEYELVREKGIIIPFSKEYFDESPFDGGAPQLLTERITSWNKGGFKSFLDPMMKDPKGEHSVSEYGINSDPRWPDRLLPGPLLKEIAMGASTTGLFRCSHFLGALPAIGFISGGHVYQTYHPDVTPTRIFDGSSVNIILGLQWQSDILLLDDQRNIYRSAISGESLVPTGAGATTQWTPNTGSNWAQVDDFASLDANYVSSSTQGQIDTYALQNTTAPAGSAQYAPLAVQVQAYIARTATGGTDPQVRAIIRLSGVNYFSDPFTLTNDTSTHHYSFVVNSNTNGWVLNPATGNPWTSAELDAAEIGYELTVAPGAGSVRVHAVAMVNIFYGWITGDAVADWLAVGPRRLFKTDAASGVVLKNLVPGLDPETEANWGDEVTIPGYKHGTIFDYIVPMTPYQKTAIVATDKGVHAVDQDGTGIRVMERIEFAKTMVPQDPWLWVSHDTGLDRWIPGLSQSAGLENEVFNQSPVSGPVLAMAFLGKWIFAAVSLPGAVNNHIIVGREARDSDGSPGPVVWDTLIETGEVTTVESMQTFRLFESDFITSSQYLCWAGATGVNYVRIPITGGSPEVDSDEYEFNLSATRYTSRLKFNHEHEKTFYKLRARGRNLTASITWALAYSIDDGVWVTVDADSATMVLDDEEIHEWFLPTSAVGTHIQARLTYTSDDETVGGTVDFLEVYAIPHAERSGILSVVLRLEDNIRHEDAIENRAAIEQYTDLEGLIRGGGGVTSRGPWGVSTIYPKGLKVVQMSQTSDMNPSFLVQFLAQER